MKPLATLSLDLDNQWSYMKTHGDAGWESFPSYLNICVPRILEFLKARNWKITFFIVGQDAALEKNHDAIFQIVFDEHEIGNHSFRHEPWLHLYSDAELYDEIKKAEDAITELAKQKPIGFRGPGYSLSPSVLSVLIKLSYHYDCSTLPTFVAPLARLFYFLKSAKMTEEEKQKRQKLFGQFSDGFKPLKPYFWQVGNEKLLEIPVTTFPTLRLPVHVSYLLYLASFSETLAVTYFKSSIKACQISSTHFSLLLHPLDFLSGDDVPELKFFPAMNLSYSRKMHILERIFQIFEEAFTVVNLKTYAEQVSKMNLKTLKI